jgi:heme exporter protein C
MNRLLSSILSLARKSITRHYKVMLLILSCLTVILYIVSYLWIFFYTPGDYLQGNLVKIMYIHVPCAWISLMSYILLGIFSTIYLIYNDRFCSIMSNAATVVSLNSSIITLVTGSIWGKAAWGTWWVWDPRLTAVFIQFSLLSVCYIMRSNYRYNSTIEQATALLTIVGLINIPIIKFAVNAWNSLHQDASVLTRDGVKIHSDFLMPLIISFLAITCFYLLIGLVVARNNYNDIQQRSLK